MGRFGSDNQCDSLTGQDIPHQLRSLLTSFIKPTGDKADSKIYDTKQIEVK